MRKLILLSALLVIFAACQQKSLTFPDGKWIDLTYSFDENTIYWPTNETFRLDTVHQGITDKGYYYTSFKYCAEEHGGTHFDAPIHFSEGKFTVDEVPVEQLMGPCVLVDVSEKALADRDYQVTVEDLTSWEDEYGEMPAGAIILLYTGYGQFWPDRQKYMGTDERGAEAVSKLHFPGLHPDAAKWLVQNRTINAIGLDTPSIDFGQSTHFECHRILFETSMNVYENIANLDLLPQKGAWIIALPMKIKGGSGAPLRILAYIQD